MTFLGLSCLAAGTHAVRAESVGINFHGGRNNDAANGAAVSGMAGAPGYSQGSWNNLAVPPGAASGVAANLLDSAGVPSGVSVQWTADDTFDTGIPLLSENDRLMRGFLDVFENSQGTIAISGITYSSYDVVVYFDGANTTESQVMSFTIGSETIFARDAANTNFAGQFVQVPNTSTVDLGITTPAGNYVVFEELSGKDFTLTALAGSTTGRFGRARINGMQIFAIVPEPSSLAMALLGVATLVWVASATTRRD